MNLVERVLLSIGFPWYPTGAVEAGIDGYFEIRDPETGEVHNAIVQVQSKATRDPLGRSDANTVEFLCDERDINYWMSGNAPVILVRSRPSAGEAYWISIKDYFADPARRKARKIIFDKTRDRFDLAARERLRDLAVPRDRGIYFAPARRRETIESNLLPVAAAAEQVFLADTRFRRPKELWDAARNAGVEIGPEWVLGDTRILSFHNLTEPPWPQFCDRGTVDSFNTSEWSHSTERDKQNQFMQLLYRCLTAKLKRFPIRWDRSRACYYFRRTADLSPRQFRYRGARRWQRPTVFQAYPSKADPTVVAYYRHTAMGARFHRYGESWYLEILPTYFFTTDGSEPHPNYEGKLKGIKALEHNSAVRGQVLMWAHMLVEQHPTLFDDQYPFLRFSSPLAFEIDAGLNDDSWTPLAENDVVVGEAEADLELFDDDD